MSRPKRNPSRCCWQCARRTSSIRHCFCSRQCAGAWKTTHSTVAERNHRAALTAWAGSQLGRLAQLRRRNAAPASAEHTATVANARPREDRKRMQFSRQLWRNYRLTVEDYARRWNAQAGKCAVCQNVLRDGVGGAGIDHDHHTGKVRGILCTRCNLWVIGFMERAHRGGFLAQAVAYLQSADP